MIRYYFRFWGIKYADKISDAYMWGKLSLEDIKQGRFTDEYTESLIFRQSVNNLYRDILLDIHKFLVDKLNIEFEDLYFYVKKCNFDDECVHIALRSPKLNGGYWYDYGECENIYGHELSDVLDQCIKMYKPVILALESMLWFYRVRNNKSFDEEIGDTCVEFYGFDRMYKYRRGR